LYKEIIFFSLTINIKEMMNRTIFTCIAVSAIGIFTKISAQAGNLIAIDSLSQIINNPKISRQEKIKPMAELSLIYADESDSLKAKKLLNQARTFAEKEKDSKYMIYIFSRELTNIIDAYPRNITGAYKIIDSVYAAISKTKDREAQAWGYYSIGYTKNALNSEYDYDDFFEALHIAEKLPEKSHEKHRLMVSVYSNLYTRNKIREKTDHTEEYLNLMCDAAEKSGKKNLICYAMNVKLSYIAFRKNPPEDKNIILQNAERLEEYISKNRNNINLAWYGRAITVLKNIYSQYPDARYQELMAQHIENFRNNAKNSHNYNIKRILFSLDFLDASERKDDAKKITLCKEMIRLDKIMRPELISGDYETLYELYLETEQYQQAAEAMSESLKYYKELVNAQTEEHRQLAEVKFETEKKEAALKARSVLYLVIGFSVIGFLISLVIIFKRRNLRLKLDKENAEQKAKLKEYERKMMEKRLVSTNLQILKKNETLEKITKKSTDKETQKLIREDVLNDKSYSDFEKIFGGIHPDFFEFLKEKAAPNKLTNLDLRYCAYIYLQKSNKDISNELNVSYQTAATNKKKLKKKLHLDKQSDFMDLFGLFMPSSH
jgi:DNA-binding CsgD family transcriptional regulator